MENLVGIVEVSNLVVREHLKFIKDTLMEKHDDFSEWRIFSDTLKTARVTSLHEKGDKENINNYLAFTF